MTALATTPRAILNANLICLASMLVWAAGLPAAEYVIPHVPPLPLTVLRTGLAGSVLLVIWLMVEGWGPVRRARWGAGTAVGGVCMGLGAVLLVIGQARTDPVTVAIITASMPLIGLGLEIGLDGRRLTGAMVAGLVLSLIGGGVALAQGGLSVDLGLGALAALGSCIAFAWGSRATVTTFPEMTPLGRTALTVAGASIAVSVVTGAYTLWGAPPVNWAAMGGREWGALAIFSIGSLAISQILWIIAVERIGIGNASLQMNAVPFYVMIFAFALGAAWNWPQTLGAGIVVLGVLIAQGLVRWPFAH
jgi:drug/metabolite transporter (DMT)-like permease